MLIKMKQSERMSEITTKVCIANAQYSVLSLVTMKALDV